MSPQWILFNSKIVGFYQFPKVGFIQHYRLTCSMWPFHGFSNVLSIIECYCCEYYIPIFTWICANSGFLLNNVEWWHVIGRSWAFLPHRVKVTDIWLTIMCDFKGLFTLKTLRILANITCTGILTVQLIHVLDGYINPTITRTFKKEVPLHDMDFPLVIKVCVIPGFNQTALQEMGYHDTYGVTFLVKVGSTNLCLDGLDTPSNQEQLRVWKRYLNTWAISSLKIWSPM